jgi:hypothetical protein
VLKIFHSDDRPGSDSRWCALASCRNAMYSRKAVRLTFSDIGFAPNTMAAMAYQTDTCAATLICCDEWPKAHQIVRYMSGSIWWMYPMDHRKVGIRMIAPDAMVKIAMIDAVSAPKVTSGSEPSYVLSFFATTSVPRNTKQPISAPTANRISPR